MKKKPKKKEVQTKMKQKKMKLCQKNKMMHYELEHRQIN